ncbi:MAG TPA: SPFH domain-containing protein [Kofleriaceae bacterium]|nr:SPFH domain-containing protein [Kofleriaceae bacterium]
MTDSNDRAQKAREMLQGFAKHKDRLWIVGAAIVLILVGTRSCTSVEPGQVAVRVNNITGAVETITQPGLILELPFGVHSVYRVDASQQSFHMHGDKPVSDLEVETLTVRASDGSNFVFGDATILFQVVRPSAAELIRDSGLQHGYWHWMKPYARSILRDEFGRESTITVSNPANFEGATHRARDRMNQLLAPHGLEVMSIVTPKPHFSDEYEELIESRNQTENQLAVIDSELQRAATDRQRQLAEVMRDQNQKIQEKKAQLEAQLATALTSQTQTKRETDAYRIDKVAAGQAALAASQRTAEELTGQLAAQYEQKRAEIEAFKNQPVERVMERLGERLEGVTIEIQPWAHDASPKRLQVEQVGGVQ